MLPLDSVEIALIKKKIKFSSYIGKFRSEQLQSHIWLTASSYMGKYLRISSYIREPFLIYDFATPPLWISLYMRKIWFSFLSVWGFSCHFLGTFFSTITETEYLQFICSRQDFSAIYSKGEGTSTSSSWFPAINEKERNPCNKYVGSRHLFWKLFRPKFSAPQCSVTVHDVKLFLTHA